MFKKKFLFVACDGYPLTEGNLDGLGLECVKLRTRSALLVAPEAIGPGPLRKLLAIIQLLGYKARLRLANRSDPNSRNVIVVEYGKQHSYSFLNTEWGQLKLLAFIVKLERQVLEFVRADRFKVFTDDEKLYNRRFPTFLTLRQAHAFLNLCRAAPRTTRIICCDLYDCYGPKRNFSIDHFTEDGWAVDSKGRYLIRSQQQELWAMP